MGKTIGSKKAAQKQKRSQDNAAGLRLRHRRPVPVGGRRAGHAFRVHTAGIRPDDLFQLHAG